MSTHRCQLPTVNDLCMSWMCEECYWEWEVNPTVHRWYRLTRWHDEAREPAPPL